MTDFAGIQAFIEVARAGGFRTASRATGLSASSLSDAVKRLEAGMGVRLLNRTTRTVTPTRAGADMLDRLAPLLAEFEAALDIANDYRGTPSGTLTLNVPVNTARLVLPRILPSFADAYPDIRVEVVVNDSFVDILAAGCDAGIRYGERLEKDMIAVPIGPRRQRFATAASPAYLKRRGRPEHPSDLLGHACLSGRFDSGALATWEFERDGEVLRIEPAGPLTVHVTAIDLAVSVAIAGNGIVQLFEDWLLPAFESGDLVPVLEPWWQSFPGPFLYYPGKEHIPAPLRAFIDFTRRHRW
ncbi:LysR family transcriptional regulator [Azospirillum picis]|uniref:DNA-binding transcriptional LysR family regulator n=1 Tax=Azospirillum picis TaxID=488438 RepID=A0ABU0MJB2_9PROT|nr:LysR family transcriptional regulator [Azospirillum picis]MBP2299763.1 DNA-binding transcriptional LysR family regulator [Azospirillum picis]MDQ0533559.1 DNA-binding transcriptional LysR family regulator [Azospirillum picis]